jgi:pilus assembly protein CpaF
VSDNALDGMFSEASSGAQYLMRLLKDEDVAQITVNSHDRIMVDVRSRGRVTVNQQVFSGPDQYCTFLNELIKLTDHAPVDVRDPNTAIIEASLSRRHGLRGSIHICSGLVTPGEPALTIRKQPVEPISLDEMLFEQQMMSQEMAWFLQQAMRARLNIMISGGSGAGKSTLARALSIYVDPQHRVCTVEDIDELHLAEWIPNAVSLLTYKHKNAEGKVVWETSQEDLVKEALRMRPDRIWVGEVRGRESFSLVKACLSGHDGSVTTIHADNGQQAVKQMVTYVLESGIPEAVAADQVARAFDLVVQVSRVRPDRRAITEITQLEPVHEGREQRRNTLFTYDTVNDVFVQEGSVTGDKLLSKFLRNGVNPHELP